MKPTIHLYTICWNEEKFLEFFFQYYDPIVDEYHFYDDGSDDATLYILEAHPKVSTYRFETIEDSYVLSARRLHESHWKNSVGRADWAIVTAVDEFLYHSHLLSYLRKCAEERVTAIPAIGFQMIADFFPKSGQSVTSQIPTGAYFQNMNKLSIFNPNAIERTNYSAGRHMAKPEGNIKYPANDELLNLHYKYLSFEETFARHQELNEKLRDFDRQNNWGHRYKWAREQLKKDWKQFQDLSIPDVFDALDRTTYLDNLNLKKWWR